MAHHKLHQKHKHKKHHHHHQHDQAAVQLSDKLIEGEEAEESGDWTQPPAQFV
jgi:hypothetical protein